MWTGSRSSSSGLCSCGGVLRNHEGIFVQAFKGRIGKDSVIMTEIWGIFWVIKEVWEHDVPKLIIECDCSELVRFIIRLCFKSSSGLCSVAGS